ncbi:type I restriction endonuclease subunit R [Amycolatopsis keratiniphila]|uniref:type I restriction endonuclease subunit R n=1 Tax=Amycolatopsis keratiniphila TaxID=129921 RepID=UPI000879DC5D|nr:type I restriction endonuclease [Amycolatopsis keratiniphila]OLZ51890.1 restriction endonuclease subunit R [Amycolatopsis keratiniphila subsp. nogabecina]SDU62206.1 type I restriction enzyme, R subunit [Amycolatopsis keratiniphila]
MTRDHTEEAFEDTIVAALRGAGWRRGNSDTYSTELGLDPARTVPFIEATQPEEWGALVQFAGGDPGLAEREFTRLLAKEIDARGALDVLRNGIKDRGVRIKLAYFRPAHTVAEGALDEYRLNQLSVTRQLRYSSTNANELDLVLFVNGIPVATAELKNQLTGQTVEDAKRQYRKERDPKELLFAKRTLVHFALDTDLVFLTTRLAGDKTAFLPFNQGTGGPGNIGGAGNPVPVEGGSGYRTAYLWEQVWQPDNWLDLIKRFLHVEDTKKKSNGRVSVHDRRLIFPRYHQWHAVRKLTDHAARFGSGNNYLVMHSAGSGKSNTIGWLAHRLSTLHGSDERDALDADAVAAERIVVNEPVFHKVVVITDRSVLDKQLQETIYQFDHTPGVVERITGSGGSKSKEVGAALANTATKVVIVTVQTFPHVLEGVSALADKRVAIIVDEAHSGQSGDSVTKLKNVLRGLGADETADDVDPLTSSAMARGRHPNLSYFAFTATPKNKTLQIFGITDPQSGEKRAFHIYSMRQAIEEGFIFDVLRNYTTFKTYWKVAKDGAEEIEVNPDKAGAELARMVYLNPATVAAHAEVIARHFQKNTRKQLGGRSKAMVVTRSRESAVRMYTAIRKAFDDLSYPDPGVLVAFSGKLEVDGVEVTESGLNSLPESQLPDAFAYTRADDPNAASRGKPGGAPIRNEYRILVVADKYQTGFDQPLLTTMYVEKPLAGVAAVQTLSRLNRTHPRKTQDDLFVLDFANEAENIQQEFKPYYEEAVTIPADPNLLYAKQRAVMDHQLLVESELQAFADAYFASQPPAVTEEGGRRWEKKHAELYRLTDPARERFAKLVHEDREAAEMFRSDLTDFVRKYGFLAQVMQFTDDELERLYLFGKHLLNRLDRRQDPAVDIGEVDLTHLRVSKTGDHDVSLEPEGEQVLPGFDVGSAGMSKDPRKALLSELIDEFNDRYGLGLSEADRLMYEERIVAAAEDPDLEQAAVASRNEGDFEMPFNQRFKDIMIDRAEADTKFTEKFFTDSEFQGRLTREARKAAYRMIRRRHGLSDTTT